MKKKVNIGLFGFGTVGKGVFEILTKNKKSIQDKLGFPIQIKKICEVNPKVQKIIPPSILCTQASDILDDPEISIIVELIGDKAISKKIMIEAMQKGKHIVTANKAILAKNATELFTKAYKNDISLYFEAAVGGAIPILRSIREAFASDKIESLAGIINGTANYILTEMSHKGRSFKDVLKEAQYEGLAEADPSSDIEGGDSAHKLVLLTALAYGRLIKLEDVHTEGVTKLKPFDFDIAERFGYEIKLLAISRLDGNEVEARVHPTLIPKKSMLASVHGAFNAIMVKGKYFGDSLSYGLGAGSFPTASAVVADIVEISRNIFSSIPGVPPLGLPLENLKKSNVKSMDEIYSEYYIRLNLLDEVGAFSKIANCLGKNKISISSLVQEAKKRRREVPVVILTHQAQEKNIKKALREIDKLSVSSGKSSIIRIEN